nr:MAG TPA: Exonuclease [Caudoviricetes sp.]
MPTPNLPKAFLDALHVLEGAEDHNKGADYSVTQLLSSPRAVQLVRRHRDELPDDDFNSKLARMFGNSVHQYIESLLRHNDNYLIEHRMVFNDKGRTVTGTADCYDKERKTLLDHKTTTTYIYGMELKPEWIQQLNIYAYFLRREGIPVEKLAINTIYKDWREASGKYKKEEDYPASPVQEFMVEPWSQKKQEEVYNKLLQAQIDAEDIPDEDLPECPVDYCWEKPSKYAVYIPGAAKATRLCDSKEEALDYIKWKTTSTNNRKPTPYQIEFRPGDRTRCSRYCAAAPFCNQYKKWLEEQTKETADSLLLEEAN